MGWLWWIAAALVSTSGIRARRWRRSHGRKVKSSSTEVSAATMNCTGTEAPNR